MGATTTIAKPFLKWAGGKRQLIPVIAQALPAAIVDKKFTYIEPFVGSGAVLFWMLEHCPNMKKAVINDVNADLMNVYQAIAAHPRQLIALLHDMQAAYHAPKLQQEKKAAYYYAQRELYNTRNPDKTLQAALFIFLNRTCFNGLYRVNRKNQYNVPMGSYKKPNICDEKNIMAVSRALQKVELLNGDFEKTLAHATTHTVFYFDPPYKPLNVTSSFNSYAMDDFNDQQQVRLRDFCHKIDGRGYKWILSNSDVQGPHSDNHFFDELYKYYHISRIKATRRINSNAGKRGTLNELLITNYKNS